MNLIMITPDKAQCTCKDICNHCQEKLSQRPKINSKLEIQLYQSIFNTVLKNSIPISLCTIYLLIKTERTNEQALIFTSRFCVTPVCSAQALCSCVSARMTKQEWSVIEMTYYVYRIRSDLNLSLLAAK